MPLERVNMGGYCCDSLRTVNAMRIPSSCLVHIAFHVDINDLELGLVHQFIEVVSNHVT